MGRGRLFQKLDPRVVNSQQVFEAFDFLLALFDLFRQLIVRCALEHLCCLFLDDRTQVGFGHVSAVSC